MDAKRQRHAPLALAFVVLPLTGAVVYRVSAYGRGDEAPAAILDVVVLACVGGPAGLAVALARRRGFGYPVALALGFVSLVITLLAIYATIVLPLLGCDPPGGDNPCTQ